VAPGLPAVDPEDGCFALPEGPGLGVTVDWDAVAEHPRERVHFDLFQPGWERRDARVVDREA
jgi:galactonate dehydratase